MDNKAFLLIQLMKYLNPHENSCSKVISILITGNSLHESFSAPQQHKSEQYKWFVLYLHRDVSHTDMLQPHFISCRGVSGAGGNMSGPRNFCQFYLVLSLFYSLKKGSNGFIAEKTILILYMIRNRYNQVPHLTQDTNGKVANSYLDITNESQEVRTIYKYITLVHPPQCFLMPRSHIQGLDAGLATDTIRHLSWQSVLVRSFLYCIRSHT